MTTDTIRARLYNKKILDYLTMDTKLLSWMVSEFRSLHADAYSLDGVLSGTPITVAATGNNMVNIAAAVAVNGVSGDGRRFKMNAGDSRLQNLKIPPDAATSYHIGLEQSDVEQGIEVNPRTGQAEYLEFKELIGRVGSPTSVTDNGNGTLTINVNSLCESGKDYSGRTVRVWLKSRTNGGIGPLSATEAVAIQTITIAFSTPNNTITVPNLMGQTVASTTAADYRVMLMGPTVKRAAAENLANTVGCLFLAAVTSVAAGNPITVIDTSGQNLIALSLSQIGQAANIQYGGGGTWSDGTTNPATTVEAQLDKIISDLSPSTGGAKIGGAAVGADLAAANLNSQISSLVTGWGKLARTNTWTLLQTFNAGLAVPTGQNIALAGTADVKFGSRSFPIGPRSFSWFKETGAGNGTGLTFGPTSGNDVGLGVWDFAAWVAGGAGSETLVASVMGLLVGWRIISITLHSFTNSGNIVARINKQSLGAGTQTLLGSATNSTTGSWQSTTGSSFNYTIEANTAIGINITGSHTSHKISGVTLTIDNP